MLELFPYDKPREIQNQLIEKINEAITTGQHLVVHAPTGLGKTIASLAPTVKFAKDNGLKVFFLTSRHSQHTMAVSTIIDMNNKGVISASNIVGKKFMCSQKNASLLSSNEFSEYCKRLKENKECEFFENTFSGDVPTINSKRALGLIKIGGSQEILSASKECAVCPYEIALQKCRTSDVIIADYYYIFNSSIRNKFLGKINTKLENCIIIVDEAHNLPDRIKNVLSNKLSKTMIERAGSEAKKFGLKKAEGIIDDLQNIVAGMNSSGENLVHKNGLYTPLEKLHGYDEALTTLEIAAENVREKQNRSYIGSIHRFLEAWVGPDIGFARIIHTENGDFTLKYQCLDPSISSKEVVNEAASVILMSGTLTPTGMYAELLGMPNALTQEYDSPFPQNNKLNIIIPKTSTKYEKRTEEMFKEIAGIISNSLNKIPGNTAIFFPSYYMKDIIKNKIVSAKTVFDEHSAFSLEEKKEFIENFKKYSTTPDGAVLYGVMGGNFSEGVDLPGTALHGVIIVGLPLTKPDLETDELIKYYDKKFGKGRDYGYVYPAFNKTLQSAGRCIRSETDRGVVIFLDERYLWSNYYKCFPHNERPKISFNYEIDIENFFKNY